ncbi:MAG: hypothetical protein ACD_63C00070G0012 [uncultured bacterium]|nr:MAG: hypothetical protein ACD_63C00070G0012 [uncultured bacterium]
MKKRKQKILVIEDEVPMLEVMADKLGEAGYDVLKARDGEEGLKVALKELPSLVLLDVMLPKMDGMEVLEKLRKHENGKTIKVILLTNVQDTERVAKAMYNNAQGYLLKADCRMDDLVKRVKEQLV